MCRRRKFPSLNDAISGQLLFNEPMKRHTTLKIGGPADLLVIPNDVADIKFIVKYAREKQVPLHVFGNGSKLLVSDKGVRGIMLKLSWTLNSIIVENEKIIAGAGCQLSELINTAANSSLRGFEFAAGIPGTLGGAIAMNAGTSLGSMGSITSRVTVINRPNGSTNSLTKTACHFNYRTSIFQKTEHIILEAEIKLEKDSKQAVRRRIRKLLERRKKTQPLIEPNAGSVFKNPPRIPAWKLIDQIGLRGFRKGDAEFSRIHANFIVNLGEARADDVLALIRLAQEKAQSILGINLVPELRVIGDW